MWGAFPKQKVTYKISQATGKVENKKNTAPAGFKNEEHGTKWRMYCANDKYWEEQGKNKKDFEETLVYNYKGNGNEKDYICKPVMKKEDEKENEK